MLSYLLSFVSSISVLHAFNLCDMCCQSLSYVLSIAVQYVVDESLSYTSSISVLCVVNPIPKERQLVAWCKLHTRLLSAHAFAVCTRVCCVHTRLLCAHAFAVCTRVCCVHTRLLRAVRSRLISACRVMHVPPHALASHAHVCWYSRAGPGGRQCRREDCVFLLYIATLCLLLCGWYSRAEPRV